MALTNPQYDAIMRMYNERQLRHQREQQEHIRIAYEKIPRLAEIDAEIASPLGSESKSDAERRRFHGSRPECCHP